MIKIQFHNTLQHRVHIDVCNAHTNKEMHETKNHLKYIPEKVPTEQQKPTNQGQ